MENTRRCTALVAAVLATCGTAGAATLDEIETAIEAAWKKSQSVSYDYKMTNESKQPNFTYAMSSTGTFEILRDGETYKVRSEMATSTVQKIGDDETKTQSQTLVINDGTHQYTLTDSNGQKTAMKIKSAGQAPGGKASLAT